MGKKLPPAPPLLIRKSPHTGKYLLLIRYQVRSDGSLDVHAARDIHDEVCRVIRERHPLAEAIRRTEEEIYALERERDERDATAQAYELERYATEGVC